MRRAPAATRPAMTPEQRAKRPPVRTHPLFMTHPITGRKVLYCNPGYAIRINELPEAESDRVLQDSSSRISCRPNTGTCTSGRRTTC